MNDFFLGIVSLNRLTVSSSFLKGRAMQSRVRQGFTLIELLVVISIIALLIAILLPSLGAARRVARQIQSSTQVRGIHQGLFIYAQSAKGLYPGVDTISDTGSEAFTDAADIARYSSGGVLAGSHANARWIMLMEGDYFAPDYAISPGETETEKLTTFDRQAATVYTIDNYMSSFALSQLNLADNSPAPGRLGEWSDTANSSSVAVSDRMLSGVNSVVSTHASIWQDDPGKWVGSIAYNDNHTEFSDTSEVEGTGYGDIRNDLPDNLFADNTPGEQNSVNHANAKQIANGASTVALP